MGNTLEEAKSAPVRKWPIRTISFAETPTWCMNKIKFTKGLRVTMERERKNNNNNRLTSSCLKIKLQQ